MTQTSTTPAPFVPGQRIAAHADRRRYTGTVVEQTSPEWVTVHIDGDRGNTELWTPTVTPLPS